jgi:hypothetical protein
MSPRISAEELGRFGIVPEDERVHPHSPDHEWWNESWFWDWFDAEGRRAGHCRFGIHPSQGRAWLWLFLYREGEWIAIEEPRLPLSSVNLADLAYEGWGLRFAYEVRDPLRSGRLRCDGFGRVLCGPRAGMVLPVGADLEVEALGAPHSRGPSRIEGHSAEGFQANRFEQPISVRGSLRMGGPAEPFEGRGERDHAWGPRPWNMEWEFLVLSAESYRLQCASVKIPNVGIFATGYLQRDDTVSIDEVDFRFDYHDDRVTLPVSGPLSIRAEDGTGISGCIEPISGAEIDITHTFVPATRSVYRRALVRFRPDGGGEAALGWLESNRFVAPEA